MSELELFIEKMKKKYGGQVVVKTGNFSGEELSRVPQPLKEVYSLYDGIEFPFGYIDPLKSAIEHSDTAEPFKSEGWFCFGFDGYFSYWLCKYDPDEEGLWITPWDHEMDTEIECVYESIVEFLTDMEEEYAENNNI